MENFVKEKIRAGKPVMGTWNTLASPLVSEVLAQAGLDFVLVDFEHGPFDLAQVHSYVSSISQHRASPLVRLPDAESWKVLQALDQGAHGVMVPRIESVEDAKHFVASTKFAPRGERGYSPFTKSGRFHPEEGYAERANENSLSLVIIESLAGMENLDSILEIPDLDVVYFGSYDLSQAVGAPGDTRNNKVTELIKHGAERANRAGKCAGGYVCFDEKDIEWCLELGLKFITLDLDSHILYRHIKRLTSHFSSLQAQ
jgi:4-hydroxy-2-oxoheptanedioate aldolase